MLSKNIQHKEGLIAEIERLEPVFSNCAEQFSGESEFAVNTFIANGIDLKKQKVFFKRFNELEGDLSNYKQLVLAGNKRGNVKDFSSKVIAKSKYLNSEGQRAFTDYVKIMNTFNKKELTELFDLVKKLRKESEGYLFIADGIKVNKDAEFLYSEVGSFKELAEEGLVMINPISEKQKERNAMGNFRELYKVLEQNMQKIKENYHLSEIKKDHNKFLEEMSSPNKQEKLKQNDVWKLLNDAYKILEENEDDYTKISAMLDVFKQQGTDPQVFKNKLTYLLDRKFLKIKKLMVREQEKAKAEAEVFKHFLIALLDEDMIEPTNIYFRKIGLEVEYQEEDENDQNI